MVNIFSILFQTIYGQRPRKKLIDNIGENIDKNKKNSNELRDVNGMKNFKKVDICNTRKSLLNGVYL